MKRIVTLVFGVAVTVAAAAQSWQDARFFTENNYLGTARTLGMGNAVTAIGGDPGTLNINPAGSAVAGYSQFVASPVFSISSTSAVGVIAPGNTSAVGLGNRETSVYGRASIPSLGAIFTLDTNRRSGWKRTSFGFVLNSSGNYTGRIGASGINEDNSYAASLATSAEGYTESELGSSRWDVPGPYWEDMVGYRSGMINGIPGQPTRYQAVTEVRDAAGNCWLAAPLYQKYGQQTTGSKSDIVFNFAADYEDRLYLGVNIGFIALNYGMTEYFMEAPENASDFPEIIYTDGSKGRFSSLEMRHSYSLRGTGVYAKAGVLWRPVAGLRLGAAFQTPALMNLTARQAYSGETKLTGKTLTPSTTPEDSWSFTMTQPFRMNLGVAYSFGNVAVLSLDYEMSNYASIRYSRREDVGTTPDYLTRANTDINKALGLAHQIRAGVEVKPTPAFAIRAGYSLVTYGQKNWLDDDWKQTPLTFAEKASLFKHCASLGAGYSFGRFFLDVAARMRIQPKEYLMPYQYYISEYVLTPEIEFKPLLTDVVLTLGWRF